jgi:D-psicose/D-tagatose/L-ribulose 3-epimerase
LVKHGVNLFLFSISEWTNRLGEKAYSIFEQARNMGFDGVEIPISDLSKVNVKRTRRALDDAGITCSLSVGLRPKDNITSASKAKRASGVRYLQKCADISAELGGDTIAGVIYGAWGVMTGRGRTQKEWDRSVSAFKEACTYAQGRGVNLCVEVLNRFETYFLNTASDAVKYVKAVDEPNAKIHLDTFHMNIEEKNFYDPIIEAGRMLGHFHISENDRGIPGTGHINWDEIFRALSQIKYNRWITIESMNPGTEIAAKAAIWRPIAPSGDAIASEGLRFLKEMENKYPLA